MTHSFQHVVITGASSGIGLAVAKELAAPGVRLSITGRNAERLAEAKLALEAMGAEVEASTVDVRSRQHMLDWLMWLDSLQPVDLLIANAGIASATADTAMKDLEALQQIFDVNVTGVIYTITPLLPAMQERGSGQIAIVSSIAGFRGMPYAPGYSASKVAVAALGEALRGRLASSGVGVSVIAPGFVRSRITDANDFPMPFFKEPDKAAKIIVKGLTRNKDLITFPWPLVLATRIMALIPSWLYLWAMRFNPVKK